MPEAQSLAADDVAKAREANAATEALPQAPIPEPTTPGSAPAPEAPKEPAPEAKPDSKSEPAEVAKPEAPAKADDQKDESRGARRRRHRADRNRDENPVEEIASKEEAEHNKPSEAAKEAAPLTGTLILPSGEKPAPDPEPVKTEKPKKLAQGEVYVDESGNVVIGE